MGLTKFLKGTAAILTVAVLAVALSGCGSGGRKKEIKGFSVPANKLPEGVISVIRPKPNNETLFVRALVFEAVRRNQVARLYTEALIHFDPKKGSPADHERLLKKMKAAWKSAQESASVATLYALGLSQLERTEGYNPYQKKTAMLTLPEIRLVPTVYAEEKSKQVKLPKSLEGKKLMSISQALRHSSAKACDVADTMKPRYDNAEFYDAAYKAANVAKSAGKVAGLVIAGGAATATAPVAVCIAGGAAFTANFLDTGLDVLQTGVVLLKGEEDKTLEKVQVYTGAANFFLNIASNAASWVNDSKSAFNYAKTLADKKGAAQSSKYLVKRLAKNSIDNYSKAFKNWSEHNPTWEDADTITSVPDFCIDFHELRENSGEICGDVKELWKSLKGDDALAINMRKTEDGSTETRVGSLALKKTNARDKEKAEALGLSGTMDDLRKKAETAEKEKASKTVATSKDLEKEAEEVSNAGDAGKYEKTFNTFMNSTLQGLIKSVLGPGGNIRDLDKLISEAAGEEMKATGIMVSRDEKGNITKAAIVGEKKKVLAPFAPEKVAGTYSVYVAKEKKRVTVRVRNNGGKLSVIYSYHWGPEGHEDEELTTVGPFTPSYDPQTGRGHAGEYSFQFTNNGSGMSLSVH